MALLMNGFIKGRFRRTSKQIVGDLTYPLIPSLLVMAAHEDSPKSPPLALSRGTRPTQWLPLKRGIKSDPPLFLGEAALKELGWLGRDLIYSETF
jgi:hypothetical protein